MFTCNVYLNVKLWYCNSTPPLPPPPPRVTEFLGKVEWVVKDGWVDHHHLVAVTVATLVLQASILGHKGNTGGTSNGEGEG